MCVYLCYPSSQIRSQQKLEALEFGLDDYEGEIGLRVHVSGHVFYELNLLCARGLSVSHFCIYLRYVSICHLGSDLAFELLAVESLPPALSLLWCIAE